MTDWVSGERLDFYDDWDLNGPMLRSDQTHRASSVHKKWKIRILALIAMVFVFLGLLGAAEVAIRWLRPDLVPSKQLRMVSDSSIGWRFQPGQRTVGRTEHGEICRVRINGLGFPDSDHERNKDSGSVRIAFLGDSFTAAVGVDFEASFVSQTQSFLSSKVRHPIEVLNFGIPSFGTVNQYWTWKEEVVPFHPDVVVLAFFLGNDVANNLPEYTNGGMDFSKFEIVNGALCPLTPGAEVPSEKSPPRKRSWFYRSFLEPSVLYQQYKLLERDIRSKMGVTRARKLRDHDLELPFWKRSYAPTDWQVYLPNHSPEFENAWRITELLIDKMNHEVSANGGQFHVALLPGVEAIDPAKFRASFPRYPGIEKFEFDLDYPRRRLLGFLKDRRISSIDLFPAFEARARESPQASLYLKFDHHFAVEGHRLAGELIATKIASSLEEPAPKKSE